MARLKQYADPGKGFYIKHSFKGKFVTYQVHPKVEDLFREFDLEDDFEISHELLDQLRETELIFTGGSGVKEEVIIEVDPLDIEEIKNALIVLINGSEDQLHKIPDTPDFDDDLESEPIVVIRPKLPIAIIVVLFLALIIGISSFFIFVRG